MKTLFAVAVAMIAGTSAAYAQQPQQPRFTTCSQAAEFAKQQCSSTYRLSNVRTQLSKTAPTA
jgi:hypothetical protein